MRGLDSESAKSLVAGSAEAEFPLMRTYVALRLAFEKELDV